MQDPYYADYIIFISQDLQQAYYQLLLIISLKEFTKLNANIDVEYHLIEYEFLCCNMS